LLPKRGIRSIDIKGAVALAVTVTSFLIVISHIETTFTVSSNAENYQIGTNGDFPDYNDVQIVPVLMSVGAIYNQRKKRKVTTNRFQLDSK
jgi:hypothetical protein